MFMGLMVSWAWIVEDLSRAKLECSNVTKDNFPCLVKVPSMAREEQNRVQTVVGWFPDDFMNVIVLIMLKQNSHGISWGTAKDAWLEKGSTCVNHGWLMDTMDEPWMGHGWTMDVWCIVCTIHFQGAIMFDQKDCWIHLDPVFRQAKPNSSRHRRLVFWTVPSMFPLCLANPERVTTSPPWFKFTSWVHNEMWVSELATVHDYFFPCPLVSSSKDAQLTARIHQALEPGTRGKAGKHLKTPPFQIRQIHDDPCSPELGDLWKV